MFTWTAKDIQGAVPEGMTLEQVRAAMLQLLAEEGAHHHRMGQLYNYTVAHKLAERAGYKDAREYFGQHLRDLSQATLTTYGAVANAFHEEVSRRFGVTRLALLLTYEEVADLAVNHAEPGGSLIEVPGENWEVMPKPFSECSVEEMRRAIQRKRKPSSSKPLPPSDLALVNLYQQSVSSHFSYGEAVRVQVRNHKGKAVLDFKGVPLAQVAKLVEALMDSLPPEPLRDVTAEAPLPLAS
ncbi:hypothetical protein [Stigmatella erecta]|uniref:Uncharacterized protein n=1 Tax=Stigmatella erecta TaxID=83460 RepID=A0A1I0KJL9_9BACT|nr:hypothetical protein [Stigmatella erecta]SEU25180.1 hypothetical protein SAMN05443639_111196 [Stigmatella erecta]